MLRCYWLLVVVLLLIVILDIRLRIIWKFPAVGGDWDWVTALMNLDFAGTLDCVRDLFPLKMDRLWEFAGLISVCLAGFNLIPLPGFDGARALGMVFKKKV